MVDTSNDHAKNSLKLFPEYLQNLTFFWGTSFQAQARCHRIGQSKSVKIYRLITRNSYEREMFDKASLKLGLDKAVLQSMSGRENATNGVGLLPFFCIPMWN